MNELTFNELPKAVSQLFDKLNSIENILLTQGNVNQPQTDQLLTIKQAGELLGELVQSNGKRKSFGKHHKKSTHKKNKRFPKTGKLLKWLINVFFVFVLRSMVNDYYTLESPNPLPHMLPPMLTSRANFSKTLFYK